MWKITFISLLIIGCSSNVDEVSQDELKNSTFALKTPRAIHFQEHTEYADWPELPTSKEVTFEVCLKDNLVNQDVAFEDFQIVGALGTYADQSNTAGCLRWKENYEFKQF